MIKEGKKLRPILQLEINEVPWRLIDKYLGDDRFPNINRFFAGAKCFTTVSEDTGELSPWVTWPSFHRGMNNREHGIKNLGQDPSTFQGKPIWDDYLDRGYSIGVCGSMQSWPARNPGEGGFYIPDTFAQDSRCFPTWVEPLQRFNLAQVRQNGRIVDSKSLSKGEMLKVGLSLPRYGVRPKTVARVGWQVQSEKFHSEKVQARSIFQAILFWDVFKKLYDPLSPVACATFFTNHIAGLMHRFWDHVFPEDFGGCLADGETLKVFESGIRFLDEVLGDVLRMLKKNPEILVIFASSMGQEAVHRKDHRGYEVAVEDVSLLVRQLGLKSRDFKPLLAMVPQVAVEVSDAELRSKLFQKLMEARTSSSAKMFRVEEIGKSLSITVCNPSERDWEFGNFICGENRIPWTQAGIVKHDIAPGTGYHIPEGVMAIYDSFRSPATTEAGSRPVIKAPEVKDFLLDLSGLSSGSQ